MRISFNTTWDGQIDGPDGSEVQTDGQTVYSLCLSLNPSSRRSWNRLLPQQTALPVSLTSSSNRPFLTINPLPSLPGSARLLQPDRLQRLAQGLTQGNVMPCCSSSTLCVEQQYLEMQICKRNLLNFMTLLSVFVLFSLRVMCSCSC